MGFWICYDCGSYDVFESVLMRLNRLSCIIDDTEDIIELENARGWCEKCQTDVNIIESDKPRYKEI